MILINFLTASHILGNKGYQGVISYVQSIRQDISDNDEHIHHLEGIRDKCSKDCAICKDAKTIVETGDEKGYLMAKALKGKFTGEIFFS